MKTNLRFNVLLILFPAAILACLWIARDFQGRQGNTFFGIAETEPQTLNFDHDISIREVRIKAGDKIKKGDTLAVFYRADLEENEFIRQREVIASETERAAEKSILEKEKEVVQARLEVDLRELETEIKLLQMEDSILMVYRGNLYPQTSLQENKVTREKIAGLQKQKQELQNQAKEELLVLSAKIMAVERQAIEETKKLQGQLAIMKTERERLVLVSPIDGYVEDIYCNTHALIPAHKDLVRINPDAPNKIIGFVHETNEVPLAIGSKVTLSSFNRSSILAEGIIVGINPKMTELPLRLRKFIDLRSWGREVYISIPEANSFFISEKVMINLPGIE
jgi:multidrug resistance efflux pump